MTRDRQQTEQRLIDAVHELITTEGFDQVRINRLSQQAKVNKILIYRYFGDLNGLLEAYYAKYMPVSPVAPFDPEHVKNLPADEFSAFCADYLLTVFQSLRDNPQAEQILKNNLLAYQPGMVNPLMTGKDEQVQVLVDAMSRLVKGDHGRPILAVLLCAMTMLTFLARDKRSLLGIPLGTDVGWQEIEEAIKYMYASFACQSEQPVSDLDGQQSP